MQRKMLRMVLGSRRRLHRVGDHSCSSSNFAADESEKEEEGSQYELEQWSVFLKRVTYLAEEKAKTAGLQEWLTTWRTKQWRWARKVVTKDCTKWSNLALQWCPLLHASKSSRRQQGRPKKRWTDDIQRYLDDLGITQQWTELAQCGGIWAELEPGFLKWGLMQSRSSDREP